MLPRARRLPSTAATAALAASRRRLRSTAAAAVVVELSDHTVTVGSWDDVDMHRRADRPPRTLVASLDLTIRQGER